MGENGCLCYTSESGAQVRVMICPVHGDVKSRVKTEEGAKARHPAGKGLERKTPLKQGDKQLDRSTPVNRVSDKQALREAYIQGQKDGVIVRMLEGNGAAWCEECKEDKGKTLDEARKGLDLHHSDVKRSKGSRYNHKTREPGVDHPANTVLVCRKCHQKLEGRELGE